jgi:hypothetical protein
MSGEVRSELPAQGVNAPAFGPARRCCGERGGRCSPSDAGRDANLTPLVGTPKRPVPVSARGLCDQRVPRLQPKDLIAEVEAYMGRRAQQLQGR